MVAGSNVREHLALELNVPSGPLYLHTTMTAKFDVSKHELVPKHAKLTEKERKDLFEKYAIDLPNLPRVYKTDPAIQHLDVKEGDIVKISRKSPTAGETTFYRRVSA